MVWDTVGLNESLKETMSLGVSDPIGVVLKVNDAETEGLESDMVRSLLNVVVNVCREAD